ncbi:MAG: hypothetical protein K8L99_34625 [Anaerolineae bacterium]|nr:hypothetical protein [Anaerolineae bacterium]
MTFQPDWREQQQHFKEQARWNQQQSQISRLKLGPDRGNWLTLWLVAGIGLSAFNLLLIAYTLLPWLDRLERVPLPTLGSIFLWGAITIANIRCLWAIWQWKRWGVYGAAVTLIVSIFAKAMITIVSPTDMFRLFFQLFLLWLLVKDKWKHFTPGWEAHVIRFIRPPRPASQSVIINPVGDPSVHPLAEKPAPSNQQH